MKRIFALLLVTTLLCACLPTAQAAFSREDWYAMGLSSLEEMTSESMEMAVDYFDAAGTYEHAKSFKQYADALHSILTMDEQEDFDAEMTAYMLQRLNAETAFIQVLTERSLPHPDQLVNYIEARSLEASSPASAWQLYNRIRNVLDANDRQLSLTRAAYDEGKRLFESQNYDAAMEALEGMNFRDSDDLYQRAFAEVHPTPTPTPTPSLTPIPTPTIVPSAPSTPTPSPATLTTSTSTPESSYLSVNEYILWGHYPQSASGNDNTPIKWQVVKVQGNHALLVSKYALDLHEYHSQYGNITWENCSLRKWLNSTFLNAAFTAKEQEAILLTKVDNSQSQGHNGAGSNNVTGGNDTDDKVFILSYAEVWQFFSTDESRRCLPTGYTLSKNPWQSSSYKIEGIPTVCWWIRWPGSRQSTASTVYFNGVRNGLEVDRTDIAVRPAIWVDMNLLQLEFEAADQPAESIINDNEPVSKEEKQTDAFSAQSDLGVVLPSFRFDEMVFSDDYAYTEEKTVINSFPVPETNQVFEHTQNITYYYDADGNLVRIINQYDVTSNGEYEGSGVMERQYTRIYDTDYFAAITTDHFVNVSDNNRTFDRIWYSVYYGDEEYDVDEYGNLLPEEVEEEE